MIDLRCGRYQDALADVESCDLCIFDAPYSEKTHGGHDDGVREEVSTNPHAHDRSWAERGGKRNSIDYWFWTESEVNEAVDLWSPRTRGWFVTITDHVLAPIFAAALERHGRYVFAPIPLVETGSRVRLSGDGPSSWTCWVIAARPRAEPYSKWGTLRGAYVGPREPKPVIGGKPLWAMKQLVEDYSRHGDLVVDICAGGGTTLLAAKLLGRRAIGAELDAKTHALALARINGVVLPTQQQPTLFDEVAHAE
jgi:hypothetical protein